MSDMYIIGFKRIKRFRMSLCPNLNFKLLFFFFSFSFLKHRPILTTKMLCKYLIYFISRKYISMCGHMVVQSSVFFIFQLKRCTARLRPIQAPHLIYLQYECITLWFGPEPGQMSLFSSVDKGAVPYCVLSTYWSMALVYHCIYDGCPVYSILRTTNLHHARETCIPPGPLSL